MKTFFSGSIRSMVMLVVFLSVLPPLGILLVSGMQSYREANEDIQRRSLRVIEGIAERQQAISANTLTILSALHRVAALKSFSDAFNDEVFQGIISEYPLFNNIFIMSTSGQVLSSGLPTPPGLNAVDLAKLVPPRRPGGASEKDAAGVLPISLSPFSGARVMKFVMPLHDRRNVVYAYLCAELRLRFFDVLFVGQPIPFGGVVYMLSDSGLLMLSSSPSTKEKQGDFIDEELWSALSAANKASGAFSYKDGAGTVRIAAYERLHLGDNAAPYLYAVLTVPKSTADDLPTGILHRDMLLLASAAAAALLAGLILCHRGFVLPIRVLLRAAGKLGGGDLHFRVTRHKHLHGEFAALNDEFNAMAAALEQRSVELEEAREAAVRSSRAKSEFLANMSHEIRTPMNAILGMAHLVGKTPLENRQKAQVEKIRDAADDLLRLLNNILDFSKIEAGKMRVESIPFHLGKLLNAVRGSGEEQAGAEGIRLVSNIPAHIPAQLLGDPSRLSQALSILLQEAMRHCRGNPVELGCMAQDNNGGEVTMHFTKSVYGTTLPELTLSHIRRCLEGRHEGAARLDSSELGLMLAGSIMHLLGGEATVSNLAGGFRLTGVLRLGLPERLEDDEILSFSGERLLLAGGKPQVRASFRELLERFHLTVEECEDLALAADVVRAADEEGKAFAALFVELPPARPESAEAIRTLKHAGRTRAPLIIMTAAQGEAAPLPMLFEAGLDAFLPRPVNESLLLDSLAGLILSRKEAAASDGGESEPVTAEEDRFNGLRALLVEDNEVNREIAREVLKGAGIVVSEAVNGHEALEMIEGDPAAFDLVLMDIEMPVMDGLTATRTLRTRDYGSLWRLPVIAMTAHSGAGEVADSLAAGMNDYATKPLVLRDLFASIRRWLPLAEEDRQAALFVMRQIRKILERSHARDPALDSLLVTLAPLLHQGRMEALHSFLDHQDVKSALAMLDEYLNSAGEAPRTDG